MTVLHSRNADAADPADVADAADVKDPQDAAAEPDLREDLGRYAELGAFTLTAETHAWYAAVDTVATPEDARAASTALAELRGSDLQQTWEAVLSLAADTKLDEPDTVAKTALLVEMLQRVHRTSAALFPAAYDADLGALAAATADSTWRRENGVKLSWLRGRSLRKQAVALATDRRIRREDLHEALTSAEIERRAWAALAPAGTLPRVPTDGALVDRTAQAFETINTGLRGLARLLPDHDLDGLPFAELIDLVERLAADEGTLYRLPTIRGLRAGLEEAGLADLLAELATAKADRRAAEAAYTARQALASGQRDGLAEKSAAAVEAAPVEEPGADDAAGAVVEADAEADADAAVDIDGATGTEEAAVEEPGTEEPTDRADAEAAALQALAGGQRDGLVEEAPAAVTAPVEDAEETAAATATAVAEAEAETKEETETKAEAEVEIEAEPASDAVAADDEPAAAQAEEETPAAVVSLPAPSPAADDLVAAATAALAEAAAADETTADTEPEAALVAEVVEVKETAVEVAVEEPVVEAAEIAVDAEVVAEPEAVAVEPAVEASVVEADEPAVEVEAVVAEATVEAEVEPVVEAEAVVAEPAVEEPAAVTAVEAEAEAVVEAEAEAVVEAEPEAVVEAEPESVVEEPVAEAEAVAEEVAEPVAEPEEPAVEPEAVAEEPAVEPEPEAEPEPVAAVEAPAAEPEADARPAKPDFTPGRPVTAYSADELLAVVRWVDGDGAERTDEELLRAAMKELGFARLGPRIKEALGAAVAAARG
ncbi:hypothetical protein [Streptomyces sp. CB02056]|uniref:hypothetical protein n=1 Tax=Streptomyces sp. CB02056 TaxID=1703924 RepID=UPI00093E8073|nr:hypothetical protein [Streptomyces sp. CB02056]